MAFILFVSAKWKKLQTCLFYFKLGSGCIERRIFFKPLFFMSYLNITFITKRLSEKMSSSSLIPHQLNFPVLYMHYLFIQTYICYYNLFLVHKLIYTKFTTNLQWHKIIYMYLNRIYIIFVCHRPKLSDPR